PNAAPHESKVEYLAHSPVPPNPNNTSTTSIRPRSTSGPLRASSAASASTLDPLSVELANELRMSKVVQLRAAIARRSFVFPKHLNLMSSDAGNRARSAGLMIVFADPDEGVAQGWPTSHCGIHDDAPRIDLLMKVDRRAVARERPGLFRCGTFAAARVRRPSIQNIRER